MQNTYSNAELAYTGGAGRNNLDFVYRDNQSRTLYVVEAKGSSSSRQTRNIPLAGGGVTPAQQGSASYLDDVLNTMAASRDARAPIATELVDARNGIGGWRVVYLEVKTKLEQGSPLEFLVSIFIQ